MARMEEVWVTLQAEGIHCWADCPFEEVAYLRSPHRHVFHIKAHKRVTHSDRDVEFIMLKHEIQQYLWEFFFDEKKKLHNFGTYSCEWIAHHLMTRFELIRCEVSEDGENGAVVYEYEDIATNDSVSPLSKYPSWYNDAAYKEFLGQASAPLDNSEEPPTTIEQQQIAKDWLADLEKECPVCGNEPTEGCKTC